MINLQFKSELNVLLHVLFHFVSVSATAREHTFTKATSVMCPHSQKGKEHPDMSELSLNTALPPGAIILIKTNMSEPFDTIYAPDW